MLNEFIADRISVIYKQCNENVEYQKLSRRTSELFKQILASLPEGNKYLLHELNLLEAEVAALIEEYIYKMALVDGAEMLKNLTQTTNKYK